MSPESKIGDDLCESDSAINRLEFDISEGIADEC